MNQATRRIGPIVLVAFAACRAETFSPSATFTIEVASGSTPAFVAPGESLPPLLLRVLDDHGRPVAGHPVAAEIRAGGGEASLTPARSGADGIVILRWTAGDGIGTQLLRVQPEGGEARMFSTEATGFYASALGIGLGMACAIDFDDRAWCWGDGWRDGVGRGDSGIDVKPDWRPIPVTGGHHFTAISAGQDAACALDLSGAAWCWGADDVGQLGQGAPVAGRCLTTLPCNRYPLAVTGGHTFRSIASAGPTTCAIDQAGAVWCWGSNAFGQLGNGGSTSAPAFTPQRALTSDSAAALYSGARGFCARYLSGIIECWGDASGNTTPSVPTRPATSEVFTALFPGAEGYCGRTGAGETWCWGSIGGVQTGVARHPELDRFGVIGGDQLATGWGLDALGHLHRFYNGSAHDASGGIRLTSIGSGAESGCGLGAGGQVWCWGSNSEGELGIGSVSAAFDYWQYPPTPVGGWYPLP